MAGPLLWAKASREVVATKHPQRQQRIQQYLDSWYKSRALEQVTDKTTRYADQIGVSPSGISVRNFKSRWGGLAIPEVSCSSTGTSLRHRMPLVTVWWFMSCATWSIPITPRSFGRWLDGLTLHTLITGTG